eukprot:1556009-Ditylum_brightwellii.AAC.1
MSKQAARGDDYQNHGFVPAFTSEAVYNPYVVKKNTLVQQQNSTKNPPHPPIQPLNFSPASPIDLVFDYKEIASLALLDKTPYVPEPEPTTEPTKKN